jgi:hypothetical protein
MQRLRDQTSSPDPMTARAAALLSAMPPLDVEHLRRRPPLATVATRPKMAGRMRTMLALAITLGSVAAAAATVHYQVVLAGFREAVRSPVVAPPSPVFAVGRAGPIDRRIGSAVGEGPRVAPAATQGGEGALALRTSAAEVRSATAVRVASASRSAPPEPSTHSRAAADDALQAPLGHDQEVAKQSREATSTDESALILYAVRALRRDGDPVRAQALAEEAMQRYPQGAQLEEAMELAMEAASTRGDVAGARRAALRYLERYPAGRFADRAQRAAALPPPR